MDGYLSKAIETNPIKQAFFTFLLISFRAR